MTSTRTAAILCVLAASCVSTAFAAPPCDVNADVLQDTRTFAKTDNQTPWREFRSIQDLPDLSTDGGASAQYWREKDGSPSAFVDESNEDFSIHTRYCFNNAGQLQSVGLQVRTAWGWGYRQAASVVRGQLQVDSSEFFSTTNGKPIPRPDGADDIPAALKPVLYLTTSKLPFAALLAHFRNPGPK